MNKLCITYDIFHYDADHQRQERVGLIERQRCQSILYVDYDYPQLCMFRLRVSHIRMLHTTLGVKSVSFGQGEGRFFRLTKIFGFTIFGIKIEL